MNTNNIENNFNIDNGICECVCGSVLKNYRNSDMKRHVATKKHQAFSVGEVTVENVKETKDAKVSCGCGSVILPSGLKRHEKTQKHNNWLLTQNQEVNEGIEKYMCECGVSVDKGSEETHFKSQKHKYRIYILTNMIEQCYENLENMTDKGIEIINEKELEYRETFTFKGKKRVTYEFKAKDQDFIVNLAKTYGNSVRKVNEAYKKIDKAMRKEFKNTECELDIVIFENESFREFETENKCKGHYEHEHAYKTRSGKEKTKTHIVTKECWNFVYNNKIQFDMNLIETVDIESLFKKIEYLIKIKLFNIADVRKICFWTMGTLPHKCKYFLGEEDPVAHEFMEWAATKEAQKHIKSMAPQTLRSYI